MKQNSCTIVSEVAKSSGVGLDELDRAIESFSAGITDSVLAVVEQTRFMTPEHLDHFFDRFQTAAHRVVRPCVKEAFGRTRVAIDPELSERFFDAPSSTGLEVELVQGSERNRLGTAPICIVTSAVNRRVQRLKQRVMLRSIAA